VSEKSKDQGSWGLLVFVIAMTVLSYIFYRIEQIQEIAEACAR
jgi:hypothetical protein